MLNKSGFHLPATDQKAEYVLKQFDRIARQYDFTNDVISFGMHRLWKARAINALSLKKDGRYLDVCCGTGDLALKIADQLDETGCVVGLDFSQNMLKIAAARESQMRISKQIEYAQIKWVEGDAQKLPFANHTFDGAIISFGLRNLTNLQTGISEMARVVKPGGKVVNLDLGHPTLPIFTPLYYFYFNQVLPLIGRMLGSDQDSYQYLPASLETYPKPESITQIFQTAGLTNIIYRPLALGSVALHRGTVA